jgi:opacity protein-like surface antigen
MKKMYKLTLLFALFFTVALAQEEVKPPVQETRGRDVIVTTEGVLLQGIVIEVSDEQIRYQTIDMREKGPVFTVPANKVYAINYASGVTQIITPRLNGRRVATAGKAGPDTTFKYLAGNFSEGVLRLGFGFIKSYSSWTNTDDFETRNVTPGFTAAYHFQVSRLLQAGFSVGFAQYEYSREFNSDYDQIYISQQIDESLWALGLFARYELTQTFIRPYIIGGVNFVFNDVNVVSDISSNVSIKSVRSEVPQSGFNLSLIVRGGVDLRLSNRFGIYGDIGSGLQLIQLGVIFILED